jgi:putative hydrolase of the HAD superfamily
MLIDTLLFDLDDTLYPSDCGIMDAISQKMIDYMVVKLGVPESAVVVERERLFNLYGTTRRGLQAEYHLDEDDFMDFIHNISVEKYLSVNHELQILLGTLPQRKLVFTNADSDYALRILFALGIREFFEDIIDIRSIAPWVKPQKEAFSKALEIGKINNPKQCVMIDDSFRNLIVAHELGLYTIQVGEEALAAPIDAVVSRVEDLQKVPLLNS